MIWARKQSVRNSKTFLPCWRHVAATLSTRSTNRLPHSLAVPPLDFRHKTACRNARSAALFVGSIPRSRFDNIEVTEHHRTAWNPAFRAVFSFHVAPLT
jgi:hypothetical protein